MRPINLKKTLKKYQSGWVALNKQFKVVASGKNFASVADKVAKTKNIVLMPAAADYSGLVTRFHG